jgi:homoserine acetyltransferase
MSVFVAVAWIIGSEVKRLVTYALFPAFTHSVHARCDALQNELGEELLEDHLWKEGYRKSEKRPTEKGLTKAPLAH